MLPVWYQGLLRHHRGALPPQQGGSSCSVRRAGWGRAEGGSDSTDDPTLRHLFEEETRKAQELLEDTAQRHEQLQGECQQLQQRRQRWAWSPSPCL